MRLSLNCVTGNTDHLYKRIQQSIYNATSINIIVSFLMESGVKLLIKDLENIRNKNIPIKILTGNYLNITQPSALYLLKDILGDSVDLRFYNNPKRSFHAKAYIFENKNKGEIFIGSSNLSKSALTDGIEWNYRIDKETNLDDFNYFKNMFNDLFLNESIIIDDNVLENYSKTWKKPKLDISENKISNINYSYEENKVINLFEPRDAQIEALYHLKKTRLDGNDKALVVAATGIGKTYISAFDSKDFNRILFVAHREEILKQAYESFKNVRTDKIIKNTHLSSDKVADSVEDNIYFKNEQANKPLSDFKFNMGFFMNSKKDTDKDIIFASVQSLGKSNYLNDHYFKRDYFDYIIIDEFHHVVSKNYQNIIEYFKPKFLLGLTATPNRLDNKDVFSICDYNVVYESNLKHSIDKGWLVPFRYYGIFDDSIDYNKIELKNGKYNEKELEKALNINKRAELILNHYKKYKSKQALGFCINKKHAEFMAKYFIENKIPACAVHSGSQNEYTEERNTAIKKLKNGQIKVIFSVDMFNEGIDIKSVDMVMFLRPTESPTVFLQQLGRGLRKYKTKKYLNVLDFIGNYKKANLIPYLLTSKSQDFQNNSFNKINEDDYPEDCFINFDFQLINLFEKMDEANKKLDSIILDEYYRIKEYLGHIPSRVELLTYIEDNIFFEMKKKSKFNIFKDYISFLDKNNELTPNQKSFVKSKGHDFINLIEKTSMSKTYKIPVFLAFYNNGEIKLKIDNDDLYKSFKKFYSIGSNKIDMLRDKSTCKFENWSKKEYVNLARKNPIKFLCKTHDDFFKSDSEFVYLNEFLEEYILDDFFVQNFIDSIEFRTKEYYKIRFFNKSL